MKFDQLQYSVMQTNWHYHNVGKELESLRALLEKNNVKVSSAIDLGCGDGSVTIKIASILGLKEIHGVDLNAKLLERAKKRGIITFNMNMEEVENKFEIAICYGSVHHFKETQQVVDGLRNLSTKYVLIIDSTVRSHFLHKITGHPLFPFDATSYHIRTKEEIIFAIQNSGMKLIDTHTNFNANIWHDRTIFLAQQ